MGLRLERQFTASFRGVEYFVRSESQPEAGRQSVLHEYPNSDQRYVEDLGAVVPVFTQNAFVAGENWQQLARDLETELNTAGPGKLVQPTDGSRSVYPLPYTKDTSQKDVGIINFTLSFAIGNPTVAFQEALPNEQQVYFEGDSIRGKIAEIYALVTGIPNLINNALVAIQDLQNGLDKMLDDFKSIVTLEFLADFEKQIKNIANKAADLITTPVEFGKAMVQGDDNETGAWQITSVGVGSSGGIEAPLILTQFGAELTNTTISGASVIETEGDETSNNTPYWPENTQERIDRNNNRREFVRMMRLNGLCMAYEQAAAGTYTTTNEIISTREKIESAYTAIMLDGTEDKNALQSNNEIKLLVERIRNTSLAVLQQKEQDLFGLATINYQYPISQFSLAYNLYAEQYLTAEALTARARIIKGLNPSKNGLEMKGELSVIEVGR